MASSERSAREHHSAHNVVAVYRTLDEARGAAAALDQAGVDSSHVELLDSQSAMALERQVKGGVGRRAAIGAGIGAVVGVLVGLVIHLISDAGNVVPEIVGVLVGLFVGAALGAFYGGATALPRDDTFADLRTRRYGVAVHADEAEPVQRAETVLKPTSPELFARFGPDGRLHKLGS